MATLNLEFYRNNETEWLSDDESSAAYCIYRNTPNEDYNTLIAGTTSYFIKYNFSDYRQSIVRWYPFRKDSSALEIGAEYGAVTGALCDVCSEVVSVEDSFFRARCICDRYSSRQNLTVYAGRLSNIEFKQKFDYILCFRKLEESGDPVIYLNHLKTLLSENGILLLTVENQYGVQYLTGKRDSYSGIPFDSVSGYGNRKLFRGYNRAALEDMFRESYFCRWKFYYPFPDYVAPRAIFTDGWIPLQNMIERFEVSRKDTSTLISDDRHIFLDAVKNGAFPFVCNHFLIELGVSRSILSDVQWMTLNGGYRERRKAFAVMMRNGGLVQKKCLYKDAEEYAGYLCSVSNEMVSHGLNVIPMKLADSSLFMDRCIDETVIEHLDSIVKEHGTKEELFMVFDRFWNDILNSSEQVNICRFDTRGMDLGPILRKAYLEMVPINSFWNNGSILYFDQELVRENCPAKYVMYRCIWIGLSVRLIDSIITREELLCRYGISSGMWNLFAEWEEKLFHDENPWNCFHENPVRASVALKNRLRLLGR